MEPVVEGGVEAARGGHLVPPAAREVQRVPGVQDDGARGRDPQAGQRSSVDGGEVLRQLRAPPAPTGAMIHRLLRCRSVVERLLQERLDGVVVSSSRISGTTTGGVETRARAGDVIIIIILGIITPPVGRDARIRSVDDAAVRVHTDRRAAGGPQVRRGRRVPEPHGLRAGDHDEEVVVHVVVQARRVFVALRGGALRRSGSCCRAAHPEVARRGDER
mmetsp:Transcript_11441/g.46349  ORF Transcript_11441/g.46349 Transcript_11441/m.46349 type:complete len:218 (-) Transcript_11441:557-1210(-)